MYSSKIKSADIDSLFEAILCLETTEECYRFFEDVASIQEIQAMATRWRVTKMLNDGETYATIAKETGVSATTISRVKHCLDYGADGYKLVLERLNENNRIE